jgi:thiopeptide-type bacteriocin biosynthesis protein
VKETVATLSLEPGAEASELTHIMGRFWGSWHLYEVGPDAYPHIVLAVVPSVVRGLTSARLVDRFFFLRYADEDGHHIRLRLRFRGAGTQAAGQMERIMERVAAENSLILVPRLFEPETERYGGLDYIPLSLDFFCLSSMAALTWLRRHGDEPRSRQLPALMSLLTHQATALAGSVDELMMLLDYFSGWREEMSGVIQQGDRVFESRIEQFTSFLRLQIEATLEATLKGEGPAAALIDGARALSFATFGLPSKVRSELLQSQMHMTANRLGLRNKEESYITRILRRTVANLFQEDSTYARELDVRLALQRSVASVDTVVNGCWETQ